MMAISLFQPWAMLMVIGAKTIETRSWGTSHRGLLWIHAGLKTSNDLIDVWHTQPFKSMLWSAGIRRWQDLPRGAVIGKVELVDCRKIVSPNDVVPDPKDFEREGGFMLPPASPELEFGNYKSGRYAWITEAPQRLSAPIPYKARQRIFRIPPQALGFT